MSDGNALSHIMVSHFSRMIELQMRCQALQVRFEDQSASLKLARESHGDMQVPLDHLKLLLPNLFIPARSA